MSRSQGFVAIPLLALAACSGVSANVASNMPAPRSVAVLPIRGSADPAACELARALLSTRLAAQGFQVVQASYVDRVLSERGWLRDPETLDMQQVPIGEVVQALGVDAVLRCDGLDAHSFNGLVLRRQSVGGALHLVGADGREWWNASGSNANNGGFLLQSGQVFTEIRDQVAHGSPMATVALLDGFVEEVIASIPSQPPPGAPLSPGLPLRLADAVAERAPVAGDGRQRLRVQTTATAACRVTFDVEGVLTGVPMTRAAAAASATSVFQGEVDLPAGKVGRVLVHVESPYGDRQSLEAQVR
jgi:hypothetical protein